MLNRLLDQIERRMMWAPNFPPGFGLSMPAGITLDSIAQAGSAPTPPGLTPQVGVLLKVQVRLTNAQILAPTAVQILGAVAGFMYVPVLVVATGDATAGTYNTSVQLNTRYATSLQVAIQVGTIFANASAQRRICLNGETSQQYTTLPMGEAMQVVLSAANTGGNAANYCDVTVYYFVYPNPV